MGQATLGKDSTWMGGRLGTPGAASFFSFSRLLSASGEIFAKQKLTSSLALTYKKIWGAHLDPGVTPYPDYRAREHRW